MGCGLAGHSSRVSREVAIETLARRPSGGSTGAGGSASETAPSHGWQVGAGGWWEASVSPTWASPQMAWASSQHGGWPPPEPVMPESKRETQCLL